MYSMTISQSDLNTWNFTWLACWLFQATSAGGEWPTYLQRLRSLPSSLGFSRVGSFCAKKGRVRSHTQPYGSQNEGLSDPTQEAGTGERPAQQKKSTPPIHFPHYGTVQTSSVLLAQPHVSPASCQKSIFLLRQQYKTPSLPSIYVKYFKVIRH